MKPIEILRKIAENKDISASEVKELALKHEQTSTSKLAQYEACCIESFYDEIRYLRTAFDIDVKFTELPDRKLQICDFVLIELGSEKAKKKATKKQIEAIYELIQIQKRIFEFTYEHQWYYSLEAFFRLTGICFYLYREIFSYKNANEIIRHLSSGKLVFVEKQAEEILGNILKSINKKWPA